MLNILATSFFSQPRGFLSVHGISFQDQYLCKHNLFNQIFNMILTFFRVHYCNVHCMLTFGISCPSFKTATFPCNSLPLLKKEMGERGTVSLCPKYHFCSMLENVSFLLEIFVYCTHRKSFIFNIPNHVNRNKCEIPTQSQCQLVVALQIFFILNIQDNLIKAIHDSSLRFSRNFPQ